MYYREFYEAICPNNSTKVPKPLWIKVVCTCGHIAEGRAEEVRREMPLKMCIRFVLFFLHGFSHA